MNNTRVAKRVPRAPTVRKPKTNASAPKKLGRKLTYNCGDDFENKLNAKYPAPVPLAPGSQPPSPTHQLLAPAAQLHSCSDIPIHQQPLRHPAPNFPQQQQRVGQSTWNAPARSDQTQWDQQWQSTYDNVPYQYQQVGQWFPNVPINFAEMEHSYSNNIVPNNYQQVDYSAKYNVSLQNQQMGQSIDNSLTNGLQMESSTNQMVPNDYQQVGYLDNYNIPLQQQQTEHSTFNTVPADGYFEPLIFTPQAHPQPMDEVSWGRVNFIPYDLNGPNVCYDDFIFIADDGNKAASFYPS